MKDLAYFAGYGKQYWFNLIKPDIDGKCDCITVCEVDRVSGKMKVVNSLHGLESPATLVVSPDGRFLYAANELNNFEGLGNGGGISAFSIDGEGGIKLINQSFAAGSCTAYITVDKTGRYILVANHGSYYYCSRYEILDDGSIKPIVIKDEGCVCLFEVREDGGVGKLLDRLVLDGVGYDPLVHGSSHPHSVLIDDDDFVVVPNKGGDNIYVCRLDRDCGKLMPLSVFDAGCGSSPRHAFFCKGTPYVLVVNEYDAHVCSYRLDRKEGELSLVSRLDTYNGDVNQSSNLISTKRPWAIDVQVHPNGKFVYVNNTQDLISLFHMDKESGELELIDQLRVGSSGMTRGMQISPDGRFLCVTCVSGEEAKVYSINQDVGVLSLVQNISLPTPTALRYVYEDR